MGKMTSITFELPEDVVIDLDRIAALNGRDRDATIGDALARHVSAELDLHAFARAGVESAEHEPMVPHDDMVAEMNAMIAAHRARCVD